MFVYPLTLHPWVTLKTEMLFYSTPSPQTRAQCPEHSRGLWWMLWCAPGSPTSGPRHSFPPQSPPPRCCQCQLLQRTAWSNHCLTQHRGAVPYRATLELPGLLAKAFVTKSSQVYPFLISSVFLKLLQGLFSKLLPSKPSWHKALPRITVPWDLRQCLKYMLNKWMKRLLHCKLWGSLPWAKITVENLWPLFVYSTFILPSQALKVRAHTQIIHPASGSCVTFMWWRYQYPVVLVILSVGHQMAEVTLERLLSGPRSSTSGFNVKSNYPFSTINSGALVIMALFHFIAKCHHTLGLICI